MVAVRAVAGDVVLARELGDLAHLLDGVVVLQIKVGDAVARRGRHGFLASGAALVLRFVLSLSVRAHLPAAFMPRAPAVLWGVTTFRGGRSQLRELAKHDAAEQ